MRPLYSVLFCLYMVLGCQPKTFDDPISFLYKKTVPLLKTEEVVWKMRHHEPLLLDNRSRSEFQFGLLSFAVLFLRPQPLRLRRRLALCRGLRLGCRLSSALLLLLSPPRSGLCLRCRRATATATA